MRLKNDELRATYNVQTATENGFILGYSVHQNANDAATLTDHLAQREQLRLPAPVRITADAVYGTEENYATLKKNKIRSFLKYPAFRAECKGKKSTFSYDAKTDQYIRLAGKKLSFLQNDKNITKTGYVTSFKVYGCSKCRNCKFTNQCGKRDAGPNRVLRFNKNLENFKLRAKKNLTSTLGIQLRKRRGNEVESIFGDIKHNQNYKRVRLQGIVKAQLDIGWLFVSLNIRKIHKRQLLAAA
ncbi:MAG: transposase [Deltaproteobacteria bacterium]|nr:transposase [Deltaproteobacteria bacterium]